MTKDDREFLFTLLQTPSPTGFEMPGQRVWADCFRPITCEAACDVDGLRQV